MYHAEEVEVGGYPTLRPRPFGQVKGFVLDISHKDRDALDDWEEKYKRVKVTVNRLEKVETYVLK